MFKWCLSLSLCFLKHFTVILGYPHVHMASLSLTDTVVRWSLKGQCRIKGWKNIVDMPEHPPNFELFIPHWHFEIQSSFWHGETFEETQHWLIADILVVLASHIQSHLRHQQTSNSAWGSTRRWNQSVLLEGSKSCIRGRRFIYCIDY